MDLSKIVNFNFIAGARKNSKLVHVVDEKQLYVYKVTWFNKKLGLFSKTTSAM